MDLPALQLEEQYEQAVLVEVKPAVFAIPAPYYKTTLGSVRKLTLFAISVDHHGSIGQPTGSGFKVLRYR